MMQLLMAGALYLLALARVPALARNRTDAVFLAAIFAGTAAVLMNPAVYVFADTLLGGINLVKLALNCLMMIGLWFLRHSVVQAVTRGKDRRPVLIRTLPLSLTLCLEILFFILTGPTATTDSWGYHYHGRIAGAFFSVMLIAFVAWACAEIAVVCVRYVPRLRHWFRVGFCMVGAGSIISFVAMAKMGVDVLAAVFPSLAAFTGPEDTPFHLMEMLAIILVGIGLTIPALAGSSARRRLLRWNLATLARVEPIRDRVLQDAARERLLAPDARALPQDRLHRMIVEIWDAELGAGTGSSVLTPEERAYLLSAEVNLNLNNVPA
ncbi:hypothetical protein AHiyo6_03770 [Arthrobacter sp. Hiyo6]|jgi:hypothetical protein|nr:hypothetical protein AHiyo6_03770 [Arthrobacter sp. Hiyo6]